MATSNKQIHVCDDWITTELSDLATTHGLCNQMRMDKDWIEVVGGLRSVAVQYDPNKLTPNQALALFEKQLSSYTPAKEQNCSPIQLPVCYHADFGPDHHRVAEHLEISLDSIADWHSGLTFTVAMIGFMPGFGYLQSDTAVPEIGRLSQPRQRVEAGSIGIIGDQSCIYSFDSPGGWPIIGRTSAKLFDAANHPPALLSAGQTVRFKAISKHEFERSE